MLEIMIINQLCMMKTINRSDKRSYKNWSQSSFTDSIQIYWWFTLISLRFPFECSQFINFGIEFWENQLKYISTKLIKKKNCPYYISFVYFTSWLTNSFEDDYFEARMWESPKAIKQTYKIYMVFVWSMTTNKMRESRMSVP